jgi:hypothetical protein
MRGAHPIRIVDAGSHRSPFVAGRVVLMVEEPFDQLEALREQLAALSERLEALSRENETLRRRRQGDTSECDSTVSGDGGGPAARSMNRRGLLAAAAGVAGGMLVAGAVTPAGADNGDPLILGSESNVAGSATRLSRWSNGGQGGIALHATAAGLDGIGLEAFGGDTFAQDGWGVRAKGGLVGVQGTSEATSGGIGVSGIASGASGDNFGVRGQCDSTDGYGVFGEATANTGVNYGVFGTSESTNGRGVIGHATAVSGTTYGVRARSDSTSGLGVEALATATSGSTYGMRGEAASTSGHGVVGVATSATGQTYGVRGEAVSGSGWALYGQGRMKVTGRSFLAAPNSAPTDSQLSSGSISFYLDQANNKLMVRVRHSNGTYKKATIALA